MMINRACVSSNRPYTSQIEEQKFLRIDLCALKLAQKKTGACLLSLQPWICDYST